MYIKIDHHSGVPLGIQIASALRLIIAQGRVLPGEQLPSARDLSKQLQVNFHTVRKAYGALQSEGLLELKRSLGTFVAKRRRRLKTAVLRQLIRSRLLALMEDMAGLDIDATELEKLIVTELERAMPKMRKSR